MKKILLLAILLLAVLCLGSCLLETGGSQTPVDNTDYRQTICLRVKFERFAMNDDLYYYDEAKLGAVVNGGRVPPFPPAKYTPEGHCFAGYSSNGIMLFDENMNPAAGADFVRAKKSSRTGTVDLTAEFKPITYTFALDTKEGAFSDGEISFSFDVTYGAKVPTMPVPAREGYTFVGWYNEKNVKATTEEGRPYLTDFYDGGRYIWELEAALDPYDINKQTLEFHAVYLPNEHTVTVVLGLPDTENPVYTVHYDDPTPDFSVHYTDLGTREIVGWSLAKGGELAIPETVSGDMTVYAIWRDYKDVTFRFPDGTENTVHVYREGEKYVFPIREKLPGYKFVSWLDGDGNPITSADFDALQDSYQGDWRETDYAVNFICPDGMNAESVRHTYGQTTQLPLLSLEGYHFLGWYADDPENCIYVLPADVWEDVTLTAKFAPRVFSVALVAEGVNLTERFATATYGESFKIAVPERAGYRFLGWYTAPEGGKQMTDAEGNSLAPWTSLDEDMTFYAVWEEIPTDEQE